MFPVSRLTACRFAVAFLFVLAVPLAAAERDRDFERIAHDFAYAFEAGDMTAFAPLSTDSPIRNRRWQFVEGVYATLRCVQITGVRITVLRADDSEALVIADVQGTGRTLTNGKEGAFRSPWTLHLRNGPQGWKIESAAWTPKEVALAFLAGGKEWSEARITEPFADPGQLTYDLANWASEGRGSRERSLAALDHAETLAREQRNEPMIAFCDSSRARMAWADKEFDRALRLGEAAVARARTAGDPDTLGAALFILAIVETNEHPERAVADYTETLEMLPKMINPRLAMISALNIGEIRLGQRDYRSATAMEQRVLALTETYRWPLGRSAALSRLGALHDHLRDFSVARQYYQQALEVGKEPGAEVRAPADALTGIAGDDIELGDFEAAIEHFRQALEYASKGPPWTIIATRDGYAAALLRMKRYDEAEKALQETLTFARQHQEGATIAVALTGLSTIRAHQGRYAEAERLAREALTQGSEHDQAGSTFPSAWPIQLALARALRGGGHRKEAIDTLRSAIGNIEAERDQLSEANISTFRFFEDKIDAYHELIDLLAAGHQVPEAFAVAERLRGHALADAFDRNAVIASLAPEERRQKESLEMRLSELNRNRIAAHATGDAARLATLRTELDAARLDLDRFDEESGVVHAAVRTRDATSGANDTVLPPGMSATAVVEYVVGERSTVVFVLRGAGRRQRLTARILPIGREALVRRIESFCHAVESGDLGYTRAARELEIKLIEPLLPALHGVSTLAIVPDAELWRLPFQALITRGGRFLIQQFSIFYTPSLSMLREAHAASSGPSPHPTLLAFGNPAVNGASAAHSGGIGELGNISPLPEAEREVRSIAALYGEGSRVYVQGEASEKTFKQEAPHYDVLHLATHGFFDDHSPMYSALLFAVSGDPAEDGLLETREILRMRLHARLAVLAACNTGRGTTGDGLIGISWAFLMAGCPTTVVTQWKASSLAASKLMVDFHRHLRNGSGNADALRLAQIAMLHDPFLRHPFYWASFVVVGAP